jgi:hypothetical protein
MRILGLNRRPFRIGNQSVKFGQTIDVDPNKANVAAALERYRGRWTIAGDMFVPSGNSIDDSGPRRLDHQMATTFQAGHGWTSAINSGTPTFNLNDTTDFVMGTQAASISAPANAQGYIDKTGLTLDTTGKVLKIWLKIENLSSIGSVGIYVASDAGFANFWLFQIQPQDSTPWLLDGEWAALTFNWSDAQVTGAPNRAAITNLRIRLNAGAGGASVLHANGVGFMTQSTAFPNGVVSLTFDDGWATQYTAAMPRMNLYGFPGTAYPIVELVGTSQYMSLTQLKNLESFSGWEIGNHAYTLAHHDAPLGTLDAATMESEFSLMRTWSVANGFRGGGHFNWPQGIFTAAGAELARKYFVSARTIYEKQQETLSPSDRFRLRIRNVQSTTTTASLQTDIDNAFANKEWLILMFHRISTPADVTTKYTPTNFNTVIDYLNTKGIPVRTIGDVLSALR